MNDNKNHIAIVCSYLNVPGGYEKAVITTANLFFEKGNKVTIIILDQTGDCYYKVNSGIQIIQKPLFFGIGNEGNMISRKLKFTAGIIALKKIYNKLQPTTIICSEYSFAIVTVLAGPKKAKIFSWEHHHFATQQLNFFWQKLHSYAYKRLDGIITLNTDEQKHYLQVNKNAIVIPNFIEPLKKNLTPRLESFILTVTRFNYIKGIDLLMAAAKIVLKSNPQLKWKVIGYGEEENIFLTFIEKENLSQQLLFKPATSNDISEEYEQASFFVLTSRNECLPLVLLEAISARLPCIAFDCETGPRHIIKQNETGILVEKENPGKLAETILSLANDKEKIKRMSDNAMKDAENFLPDKIYQLWENIL